MKTVRVKIDPGSLASLPKGRINKARLDATTERNIAEQKASDDAESMHDAAWDSASLNFRIASTSRLKRYATGSKASADLLVQQRRY
jgi:hypothetical protein